MRDIEGIRLLLVEDDRDSREALTEMLEKRGIAVVVAVDAEQGLAELKASECEVVVADIKLPGMDGIEYLRRVREHDAALPLLLLTGYGSLDTAAEAVRLGAQDYILKPLDSIDSLVTPVTRAVGAYRLTRENRRLQQELRDSEEKFRTLFFTASDAVFLCGVPDENGDSPFLDVNDATCAMLGLARDKLLSTSLADVTSPEHAADLKRARVRLETERQIVFESVLCSTDGSRIPVELSACSLELGCRTVVLAIARDISERRRIEQHIAEAAEAERQRLSEEMHDALGQKLTELTFSVKALHDMLTDAAPAVSAAIDALGVAVREAVAHTREIARGLYPADLEMLGLTSALVGLARRQTEVSGIPCVFDGDETIALCTSPVGLHLYRIAQEGLNNAIKHASARRVELTLRREGDRILLRIRDDGSGLDPSARDAEGAGLKIMKHRAALAGGALEIEAAEGRGTVITCIVPGGGEEG